MPGMKNGDSGSTLQHHKLLYNTENIAKTDVMLDGGATDASNTGATSEIRRGTILVQNTSTGRWDLFDHDGSNGLDDESNAVVLEHDTQLDGSTHKLVTVYIAGDLVQDELHFDTAGDESNFDASAVKNIRFW